ncbi:PLP-dependent transferase [Aureobasidium pullulans EXF-150]|uniref:PLP-dependent transferase n=1 Tax=Aureobasidium pullulans EXF-150 TaxID=1043002 RepID=A0A074X9R5_AURPU|nr:PLP-dependent transferase [Aureobasidium pullulans EXF-150]KEQ80469.1 PLP-dependent transferase [Aureobasidium pullulans EXF-150]
MACHPFVAQSSLFHRTFAYEPETIESGQGITLITNTGRRILDASSGPAVSCLGHSRPDIAQIVAEQINKVAYVYSGSRFTSQAGEELATELVGHRPGGLSKAIFVNSGSEATDAAIKLATQYWHEVGQPQKRHSIARKQSYHGNTLGALSISGHDSRRQLYADWLSSNVSFVEPNMPYRFKHPGETDAQYLKRSVDEIEDEIQRLGPQHIMCGMGKTGTLHAWEQEGIRGPDLQTIGKALGAGFLPLSAVLVHEKIFDALVNGSGGLAHGHTFQAHPAACASALAVQRIMREENILDNVKAMGRVLSNLLHNVILPLPFVGDVRGRGLFWSVEFILDEQNRTPPPSEMQLGTKIVNKALDMGLSILGNLGQTGAVYLDFVIVSPPYSVTEAELIEIIDLLKDAIIAVTDDLGLER